jgi:hypothetical protein
MHGHLHRAYRRTCDFGYGPVQVTGLATDGSMRNFAVLDVTSMEWRRGARASWRSSAQSSGSGKAVRAAGRRAFGSDATTRS